MGQDRVRRDAELVAQAKAGEVAAFEQLVTRHRTRLYELARQLVSDREAAQDIVQEGLVRAFRALPALRETDRFGPWVNTIMRRLCQQWQRDGRRRLRHVHIARHHLHAAAQRRARARARLRKAARRRQQRAPRHRT